jgi:hypothetical protein
MFGQRGLGMVEVFIISAVFVVVLMVIRARMRARSDAATHMTSCRKCGERVARAAAKCPKCGGPLR